MSTMRIAQVMLGKGFGGAERSFVDISRVLAERGHRVLAIGDPRGRALAMLDGTPGISCKRVTCLGSWDRIAAWRAAGDGFKRRHKGANRKAPDDPMAPVAYDLAREALL